MRNWLNTVLWIGFTAAAVYTLSEWAVLQKSHGSVEQDGASAGAREVTAKAELQQARDAAPSLIDVEGAYRAVLRKHIERHGEQVNRLDLEVQRIERQMRILRELKADQDRRLELAGGVR